MATHYRITDPLCKDKDKGMVPGDVGVAGRNFSELS
jgi:hypothetical protein